MVSRLELRVTDGEIVPLVDGTSLVEFGRQQAHRAVEAGSTGSTTTACSRSTATSHPSSWSRPTTVHTRPSQGRIANKPSLRTRLGGSRAWAPGAGEREVVLRRIGRTKGGDREVDEPRAVDRRVVVDLAAAPDAHRRAVHVVRQRQPTQGRVRIGQPRLVAGLELVRSLARPLRPGRRARRGGCRSSTAAMPRGR